MHALSCGPFFFFSIVASSEFHDTLMSSNKEQQSLLHNVCHHQMLLGNCFYAYILAISKFTKILPAFDHFSGLFSFLASTPVFTSHKSLKREQVINIRVIQSCHLLATYYNTYFTTYSIRRTKRMQ